MTTITWIDKETGKGEIQILNSKDKLEAILQQLKTNVTNDNSKLEYYIEEKQGRKKRIKVLRGVSYESASERALFSSYGIIPKKKEYLNSEEDSDD